MRKMMLMAVAAVSAATALADVPGTVVAANGEAHTGKIRWSARDKAYVVDNKGIELQVKLSEVDRLEITKPAGYDDAVAKVEKGQPKGAIPVLEKIVKDYANLQWDKTAGRYLVEAYLADDKAEAALKACQSIILADSSAAYSGDLAPAYWKALLAVGKNAVLESNLEKAAKTGDRFSSASALIMRGDMLMKAGAESPDACRKALTDGYLRVVLLYREPAVAPRVRPEALFKAARCFEKLRMAPRAEAMRQELKKLYGSSTWAMR